MNTETYDKEKTIKTLQKLLRGSLSAHSTYGQAIEKFEDRNDIEELSKIRADHRDSVEFFRRKIEGFGEKPDESAGAWGVFANTVMGAAKTFGEEAAAKALIEGEEHGLKDFEEALKEPLPDDVKIMIQQSLVPNQKTHLLKLERLPVKKAA